MTDNPVPIRETAHARGEWTNAAEEVFLRQMPRWNEFVS